MKWLYDYETHRDESHLPFTLTFTRRTSSPTTRFTFIFQDMMKQNQKNEFANYTHPRQSRFVDS